MIDKTLATQFEKKHLYIYFVVLVIIAVASAAVVYQSKKESFIQIEQGRLNIQIEMLKAQIEDYITHLSSIANEPFVAQLNSDAKASNPTTALLEKSALSSALSRNSDFISAEIIDNHGLPTINLTKVYSADGQFEIKAMPEVNHAGGHFYEKLKQLTYNQILLSQVHLSEAHYSLPDNFPHIFHIGTKIYNQDEQLGYLQITINPDKSLTSIKQIPYEAKTEFGITDSQGDLLYYSLKENLVQADLMEQYFPVKAVLFNAMKAKPEGKFKDDGGNIWLWKQIKVNHHKVDIVTEEDMGYIVVKLSGNIFQSMLIFYGLTALAICFGLFLLVYFYYNSLIFKTMKEDSSRFNLILEASLISLMVVDKQGKIAFVNNTLCELFGYCKEDLIGQAIEILIPDDLKHRHVGLRNHYLANTKEGEARLFAANGDLVLRAQKKDGSQFRMELLLSTYEYLNEKYVLTSVVDIESKMKLQEEADRLTNLKIAELKDARNQAELTAKLKSDFLANMSHEIRTPLNAVIGMSDLLANSPNLPESEADLAKKVNYSGKSLLSIINDILDFSKIEAGKLEIEAVDFSINAVISQLRTLFEVQASKKGIEFEIESGLGTELDLVFTGGRVHLEQILVNLIGNAIKFTHEGKVKLVIQPVLMDDSGCLILFEVHDTGIGMTSSQVENIFKPFNQASASISGIYGGTGLGLSICMSLVELMGGRLNVKSQYGKGSCFSFSLPFSLQADQQLPNKESFTQNMDLSQLNILVVDDNDFNLEVAQKTLELWGCKVTVFENPVEAVKFLQTPNAINLILMDLQMPVMDGFEATKLIRRNAQFRTVPIIACSAGVTVEQREMAELAGMNGFLAKPFTKQQLKLAISAHMDNGITAFNQKVERSTNQIEHFSKGEDTQVSRPTVIESRSETILFDESESIASAISEKDANNEQAVNPYLDAPSAEVNWGDSETFKLYLNKFFLKYADMPGTFKTLTDDGDITSVGKLAHKIKGAATSVFLTQLSHILREIELNAGDGTIINPELQTKLETCFQETKHAVEQYVNS